MGELFFLLSIQSLYSLYHARAPFDDTVDFLQYLCIFYNKETTYEVFRQQLGLGRT
jgi:hypothetical protein